MSDKSSSASGGIGLGSAIFLVFLVLKLTGTDPVAAWSWWWVTSPLWIPLGVVFACLTFIIAMKVLVEWSERRARLRRMMD